MSARRRTRSRGFTLVELMIALVAGVVVSIAVIGLAKSATNTFHEQVRLSSVEGSMRAASERLRNELTRASFMGTGNIQMDPKIARVAGAGPGTTYHDGNSKDFQGIHIVVGGSLAANAGLDPLTSGHFLKPDLIRIGGNLTTDDMYRAQLKGDAPTCGNLRLTLDRASDAATDRLIKAGGFKTAFTPVAGQIFSARVLDPRGCYHFAQVCGADNDANKAWIDLQNAGGYTILTTTNTGNDVCGANLMEEVSVSPYQLAEWSITPNTDARISPDLTIDGAKFNLQRQFVDTATGLGVGAAEIVAEYAIDMKFGIVMQNPTTNAITVYDMDSDAGGGAGVIDTATKNASGTTAAAMAAQNVKSVRFRLSARAAVPDRTTYMTGTGPAVTFGAPYLSRYCVDATGGVLPLPAASCKRWTRVRTIISEVALINQARMFY